MTQPNSSSSLSLAVQELEPHDYRVLFACCREAHPGEYDPHHTRGTQKFDHAREEQYQ